MMIHSDHSFLDVSICDICRLCGTTTTQIFAVLTELLLTELYHSSYSIGLQTRFKQSRYCKVAKSQMNMGKLWVCQQANNICIEQARWRMCKLHTERFLSPIVRNVPTTAGLCSIVDAHTHTRIL